jgi:hypothetical protein
MPNRTLEVGGSENLVPRANKPLNKVRSASALFFWQRAFVKFPAVLFDLRSVESFRLVCITAKIRREGWCDSQFNSILRGRPF